MKTIPLSQGKFALVDDDDYAAMANHKWYALRGGRTFYAVRKGRREDGTRCHIKMHNEIMPPITGFVVDHKDRNGLNNQRLNLRHATTQANGCNRTKAVGYTSKYKGVYWNKTKNRWKAIIYLNGIQRGLGTFLKEEDAAAAYDQGALRLHGEFASLNFNDASETKVIK